MRVQRLIHIVTVFLNFGTVFVFSMVASRLFTFLAALDVQLSRLLAWDLAR